MLAKHYPKLLICLFIGISLAIRIIYPYNQVFDGDYIKYTGVDAYYHMRLVDTLVHNFPNLTYFDPYSIYPIGSAVGSIHFFNWLLAGIIWIVGMGNPSKHLIDVMGVYYPVVLAALVVIPTYFIGRDLFGKTAGIISAGLIAILPGEFLGRSILGFTDQHAIEVLLSTTTMMLFIMAIKKAQNKVSNRIILLYSLSAGLSLGLYSFSWVGALLLVFIIALYVVCQFVINHLNKVDSFYLCKAITPAIAVALIFCFMMPEEGLYPLATLMVFLLPILLYILSNILSRKGWRTYYYPIGIVSMGIIGMVIFYAISPVLLKAILAKLSIFAPSGSSAATTLEMQPLFSPLGEFTLSIAWGYFTTGLFLMPIGFILSLWIIAKNKGKNSEWLLLVIWSLIILLLTIAQRRFAYYFAVNVALFSGYALALSMKAFISLGITNPKNVKRNREQVGLKWLNITISVILLLLAIFLPNMINARIAASSNRFMPSNAWMDSLSWLRNNTPEPLGTPDAYYDVIKKPAGSTNYMYPYPETAYGVTAWWDYGYWITRIAHRMPSTNPSQETTPIKNVANLFLSDNKSMTNDLMQSLKSSYVIIDDEIVSAKYHALITWSGRNQGEYYDIYYVPQDSRLQPIIVFYPAYYRSLCVRMFVFNGESVSIEKPIVITYSDNLDKNGNAIKVVTEIKDFGSYQSALDYMASRNITNQRIVGANNTSSPIALEAVTDFKLVYNSANEVKIYEYIGN